MIIIVLFVLTVNLLLHRPVMESLLFAVALAVGLSPELLPAIISVTLSAGARAMSKRGVIVRRLDAIENLGSMDILCTDKTGTLTEGTLVLSEVLDNANQPSAEVRQLAFLNAAFETGIENPLDTAIVAAGERAGLTKQGFTKIDEIPYDFMRRMLTIVVAEADSSPSTNCMSNSAERSLATASISSTANVTEVTFGNGAASSSRKDGICTRASASLSPRLQTMNGMLWNSRPNRYSSASGVGSRFTTIGWYPAATNLSCDSVAFSTSIATSISLLWMNGTSVFGEMASKPCSPKATLKVVKCASTSGL